MGGRIFGPERAGDTDTFRRRVEADGPAGLVPGVLFTVDGAPEPRPLLLLGHGGGGDKDQPRFRELATRLARAVGAAVLVIDGPAHGERAPREGTPVERFRAARRVLADPELPARMSEDWRAAAAVARGADGVGDGPLGYAGFSMGTLLGVPAVANLGGVGAAVFGVGGIPRPGGVADLVRGLGRGEAAARIIDEEDDAGLRGRLVVEAARRIRDCQVLMLNMTQDEVFPMDGALELFAAFPCRKRMVLYEGSHVGLPAEGLRLASEFLRRHLRGRPEGDEAAPGAW